MLVGICPTLDDINQIGKQLIYFVELSGYICQWFPSYPQNYYRTKTQGKL